MLNRAPYDPYSGTGAGGADPGKNPTLVSDKGMDYASSPNTVDRNRSTMPEGHPQGATVYPKLLVLDDNTLGRLRSYIDTELTNHYSERSIWIQRLQYYQTDYWAEPVTTRATYPFVGASRIIIPLTAIAVETFHARAMTTLYSLPQFSYVKSKNSKFSGIERGLERLLDTEILGSEPSKRALDNIVMELEKYGTGIGKSVYEKIIRKAVRELPDGTTEPFYVTTKQGNEIKPVSTGRFLMPFAYQDAQDSPWCGEEHEASPYMVKNLVENGFFYSGVYDQLWNWVIFTAAGANNMQRKFTYTQEQLEDKQPNWPNLILWQEVWLCFDVDADGEDEEIVVHYHHMSGTFLAIRYNWYNNLRRPYRKGNFIPVEHRWAGIGIAQQNEQFQREITTIHRQRLDAGTIANVPMLKVSKLSGISVDEPIFPGKKWFLDSLDQLDAFRLSDVPASAYSNEQAALIYSQQRTAINDVTMGMPQAGTPGTATGDLARLQEGNKRFDYIYGNIKGLIKELQIDTLCNIQQFGARNMDFFMLDDEGPAIAQFLASVPPTYLENGLILDVGPVGQQQNKIINRQNWTQIAAFLQQYYAGLGQLLLPVLQQNPQLMQQFMQQTLEGTNEAMQQLLESFDVRNMNRIIFKPAGMQPSTGEQLPPDAGEMAVGMAEEDRAAENAALSGGGGMGGPIDIQGLLGSLSGGITGGGPQIAGLLGRGNG
jgi:hypothetical protein